MRILQLNFERGWRGGERQTLLSMQAYRAAGHEVVLLARAGGDLASRAQEDGFMVYPCSGIPAVGGTLLRYGRQFDVLHAQTANMMTWLALLKPFLRARIVFTRRTAFPIAQGRDQQTRWKWRQADVVVAISQAAAVEPRRLGLDVVVIPSAVQAQPLDSQHLHEFASQFDLPLAPDLGGETGLPRQHLSGQHFVLATAAAMSSEKDPLTLIRAIHAVRQVRDDFVFLHLGAGGDIEYAARELVHDLGLERHYVFAGFHRAIEDIYRLMDVFVLSSKSEALGTSVLDAFLYRVPVVSTDAGGLKESLAQGRGLLCAIGDHEALAASILRLLSDESLRVDMADKAHRYVRSEHDVEVMAKRYLKVYTAT
ncbi:glycosyltransferase family 4 protein [Alcaligenaceae bacterium]|nr:glycosyltransferase family 4 protein [Alcaligenaceae bacterium]